MAKQYLNFIKEDVFIRNSGIEGKSQISIPDSRSSTGFGYLTISSSFLHDSTRKARQGEQGDERGLVKVQGFKTAMLDDGPVKYDIRNAENKFEKIEMTAAEAAALWKASQDEYHAAKGKDAPAKSAQAVAPAGEGKPAAVLEGVKAVYKVNTKFGERMKVCFNNPEGEGTATVLVDPKYVTPHKDREGDAVAGRFDVRLGNPDRMVNYQIKTDSGYENHKITAGALAEAYAENREAYRQKREADKQTGVAGAGEIVAKQEAKDAGEFDDIDPDLAI